MRRLAISIALLVVIGPAEAGHYGFIGPAEGEHHGVTGPAEGGHYGLMGPAAAGGGAVVFAQEGHPLTGTWAGDWGPTSNERTRITLVMTWDGKAITGTLNPGPDQATLTSVTLDPATWTVRIEADTKDAAGRALRISAEGKLEDIASYHRTLAGTWTQGTTKGTFKVIRD